MSSPATPDIGTEFQALISSIISAIVAAVQAFANWLQTNGTTVASILGWALLGGSLIYIVTRFGGAVTQFLRGLLRL